MISFQQVKDGVTALVRSMETGEKTLIRAKYMVACDGNRSPVREHLGISVKRAWSAITLADHIFQS
ncbi:uncharacterized protein K441DRAFT_651919 [Cenococcum geophilum 1.58]|uniref:uncharacterized protein n=1 Tax=Cenococcum geophilum 1.58 TaxID=794803 RepID=UPI00358FDA60|nr:hypothetical protein K441DRAFT_651919 [Cenococcum geophilum 1.58]